MLKNYTFDKKSIWNYFLKVNISTFFIVVLGGSLYYYIKNKSSVETVLIGALGGLLGWFLFFALPLIILFFNHRKHSKNVDFSVNSDNSFKYVNGCDEINFYQQDIEKIELWLTPAAYDKRIHWIGFEKYFFTRLYTKQNQIINLSCLLCDDTEQIFNKDLIVRKKKIFPLMKQNEL